MKFPSKFPFPLIFLVINQRRHFSAVASLFISVKTISGQKILRGRDSPVPTLDDKKMERAFGWLLLHTNIYNFLKIVRLVIDFSEKKYNEQWNIFISCTSSNLRECFLGFTKFEDFFLNWPWRIEKCGCRYFYSRNSSVQLCFRYWNVNLACLRRGLIQPFGQTLHYTINCSMQ